MVFLRQEFPWEDIEIHGKGDFIDRRNDPAGIGAWAKYDQIIDMAADRDVEIIARLSNPPSWTRALTDTIGTNAPPDNFNDFGDFAATVAERYQGDVTYYQSGMSLTAMKNGASRMWIRKPTRNCSATPMAGSRQLIPVPSFWPEH
ncbi:MAG: hypothetical protein R3C44_09220 [Chloroflexota bacterium]